MNPLPPEVRENLPRRRCLISGSRCLRAPHADGTRAGCSSTSGPLGVSSCTGASPPGAAAAPVPGCLSTLWLANGRSHEWSAAAAPTTPPAAKTQPAGLRSAFCPVAPDHMSAGPQDEPGYAGRPPGTWRHTRSTPTGIVPTHPTGQFQQRRTSATGRCSGHCPHHPPSGSPPRSASWHRGTTLVRFPPCAALSRRVNKLTDLLRPRQGAGRAAERGHVVKVISLC
nr:hypothetical protein [Kibdelosporangium sp. MJ126-NF4]CTQ95439.1 hypothetical protein [Kibdelosporangium sp. MJ126-NF4]